MRPFKHLSCTDFDLLWDNIHKSVFQSIRLWKFLNFWLGVLQAPKKLPQKWYFWWGACYQHTAQIAQFLVIEIILGASWHPKYVPFVLSFDGRCTVRVSWLPEDVHFVINTTLSSLIFGTHTHTPVTTWVSQYQKGKTNLDYTETRDSEWQWHHLQVCTSLQTDNYASTPPLSFFTVRVPFLLPIQQRQSTEDTISGSRKKYCVKVDRG